MMRMMGLLLLATTACSEDVTQLLAPTVGEGEAGDRGADGALLWRTSVRVRGDRLSEVDVIAPSDDGRRINDGEHPVALLVSGGAVAVDAYHWLAVHLASRGVVVVAPHFLLDLAFFEQGNALDALLAVRRMAARGDGVVANGINGAPALAIGHSLGGVVASKAWLDADGDVSDGISHLVLTASIPDGADQSQLDERTTGTVVSIAGALDGLIGPDQVDEGAQQFGLPVVAAQVDGLTHFQWTDVPAEEAASREDTVSPLTTDVARSRATWLIDIAVDDWRGDGEATRLLHNARTWPSYLTALPSNEVQP
jgi:hypothetical protein